MAADHHHHHQQQHYRPNIKGILTKMSSIGGFSSNSPSQNGTQFEPLRYRVALMGRGRVGKTALLKRFLFDQFPDKYRETVEDLHTKSFDVNGLLVQADFLDTAGNIAFPAMRRLNISTAQAFILVYKLEPDMVSFEEVRRIFEEIVEIRGVEETMRIPIVIVENQIDLENENGVPISPVDNTFSSSMVFDRDAVFRNGSLSQRPSNTSGRSSTAGSRSASTSDGSSGNNTIDYCSRRNSASREVEEFLLSKSFEYKVSFVRSSAKLNLNVRPIFEQIAKLSGLLGPRSPVNGYGYNNNDPAAAYELDDAFRDINLHLNNGQGSTKMKKQPPPSAISKFEAVANKAKRRFSLQSHCTLSHIPSAVLNEAGRLVDRLPSSSDDQRSPPPAVATPRLVAAFHYSPAHHAAAAANANGSTTLPHAGPRRRQSEREAAAAAAQTQPQPTSAAVADAAKDKDRKGSLPAGQQQQPRKSSVVASLFGGKKSKSKSGEYLNAQECYVQ